VAVVSLEAAFTKMRTATDRDKVILPSLSDVPQGSWARLAQSRIFFGHQSVGYNIVDGVADVMNEHIGIDLKVAETYEPQSFAGPVFAHARVGRNTEPLSKIKAFREILDSGAGDSINIAFFKFCYVDIVRDSDPQEIFDSYAATLEELKNQYPQTTFLHVTAPIRSLPKGAAGGLKQSFKSLVGKPGALDDNAVRERYNKLLTDAYGATEPIFDLAQAESVNLSGSMCHAGKGPHKVCVMAPEYTDDGGHLGVLGRKRVAEQLLIILAGIANSP